MQAGNVFCTYAETYRSQRLEEIVDFKPTFKIKESIGNFVDFYKQWKKV